jgi:hypothetical protein
LTSKAIDMCRPASHSNARFRRGFTILELTVISLVVMGVVAIIVPAMSGCGCRGGAQGLKDKTQISMIHKSFLTFAGDNKLQMPLPGLINTRPACGPNPSGEEEDFSLNTTANLYSAMIAQNYFNTDIIIGTTEVNSRIVQKKDYNFNAYKPALDVYWDTTFVADPTSVGNASYAHSALVGARRNRWSSTGDAGFAALGTRGTGGGMYGLGGALTGAAYDRSPTLELHGPKKTWDGHVCFNDNHVETLNTFYASLCTYTTRTSPGLTVKDNFFAAEFIGDAELTLGNPQAAGDSWLIMCTAVEPLLGSHCTPVWDPLNP